MWAGEITWLADPLRKQRRFCLLVSSYVSAQLPTGEIGLHQLHWTCRVTEPIPLHTKTNPVEQQFPVHLQLNESKVRLLCSGDFD